MNKLCWENIDFLSDADISYLLYKEGKDINLISKIRGLDKIVVEKHIIECKIKYRADEMGDEPKDIILNLMKCNKKERVLLMERLDENKKKEIERYVLDNMFLVTRDECLFYIWLLGELKSKNAVSSIITFLKCTDGNIKRICCSSLGKIGDISSEEALINVLNDTRPQVKQYAIKALGRIKSKKAIPYLQKIISNINEKEYIINSAKIAIAQIEGREIDV